MEKKEIIDKTVNLNYISIKTLSHFQFFLFSKPYSTKPLNYFSMAMGSARSAPLPAGPIKPQLADLLCNRLRDGTHHKYEQRMNFPLNKAPERALHCLLEDRWGPNSCQFFDLLCDFPVAALGVTHSRQDLWPLCACPHCGHSRLLTTTSAPCMQSLMSFTARPIIAIPSKILQKSNFTDGETGTDG